MCDCIDELTNKITKHYTEPDKRVESVKIIGHFLHDKSNQVEYQAFDKYGC